MEGQGVRKGTYWTEVTGHSDLMFTSLTDGTTRAFAMESPTIPTDMNKSGVAWTEFAVSQSPDALLRLRLRRFRTPGLHKSGADLLAYTCQRLSGDVVETGNRLYWTTAIPGRSVRKRYADGDER